MVGPEVDLPDAEPDQLDAAGPRRPRPHLLHVGHHRRAQGGGAQPPQPAGRGRGGAGSAWRWTPDDRLVHCLPLFHAHGLCVGVYGTLSAGASAVLLPGFDPAAVADAVAAEQATLFFGVPTMYHRLVRVRAGRRPAAAPAVPCRGRRRWPADLHAEVQRGRRVVGARALRDDRDPDEHLQPL